LNSERKVKPGIKPEAEPAKKKRMETPIFLFALYALTMIFIILVVCDNWQP
jgi:hypothetical protein